MAIRLIDRRNVTSLRVKQRLKTKRNIKYNIIKINLIRAQAGNRKTRSFWD